MMNSDNASKLVSAPRSPNPIVSPWSVESARCKNKGFVLPPIILSWKALENPPLMVSSNLRESNSLSRVTAFLLCCALTIQRCTADNALKNFTDGFSLKFSQTCFFLPRQKQKHSPHIQMKLGSRPTEILLCAQFNA